MLAKVEAVVSADVWRGEGAFLEMADRVPASPHERLVGVRQYAVRIENEPGKYAVCVPFLALRSQPGNGDLR
jgi:hypothetical protein